MVVVDELSKAAHFIPDKSTHKISDNEYLSKIGIQIAWVTQSNSLKSRCKIYIKFFERVISELGNSIEF